jgi:hypothetical protein
MVLHDDDDARPAVTAGTGEDIGVGHAAHQRAPRPRVRGGGFDRERVSVGGRAALVIDSSLGAIPRQREPIDPLANECLVMIEPGDDLLRTAR